MVVVTTFLLHVESLGACQTDAGWGCPSINYFFFFFSYFLTIFAALEHSWKNIIVQYRSTKEKKKNNNTHFHFLVANGTSKYKSNTMKQTAQLFLFQSSQPFHSSAFVSFILIYIPV